MKTEQLIEAAKDEARKQGGFTPELEAAVREGLVDGDRIGIAPGTLATVTGGEVVFTRGGTEGGRALLAALTEQQIDTLIIRKAVFAGRVTTAMG